MSAPSHFSADDFASHQRMYRKFVWGMGLAALFTPLILLLIYLLFG